MDGLGALPPLFASLPYSYVPPPPLSPRPLPVKRANKLTRPGLAAYLKPYLRLLARPILSHFSYSMHSLTLLPDSTVQMDPCPAMSRPSGASQFTSQPPQMTDPHPTTGRLSSTIHHDRPFFSNSNLTILPSIFQREHQGITERDSLTSMATALVGGLEDPFRRILTIIPSRAAIGTACPPFDKAPRRANGYPLSGHSAC